MVRDAGERWRWTRRARTRWRRLPRCTTRTAPRPARTASRSCASCGLARADGGGDLAMTWTAARPLARTALRCCASCGPERADSNNAWRLCQILGFSQGFRDPPHPPRHLRWCKSCGRRGALTAGTHARSCSSQFPLHRYCCASYGPQRADDVAPMCRHPTTLHYGAAAWVSPFPSHPGADMAAVACLAWHLCFGKPARCVRENAMTAHF